jgi:hypothetical protein
MAEGVKGGAIALACVSIALLLYSAQLPQHGDGAIGTAMVLAIALAAYVLTLILSVPLIIRSFARGETIAEAGWLCGVIAAPMLAGLLIIGWSAASL